MSLDLELFMKAMDGEWKIVSHEMDEETGRPIVSYKSIDYPELTWSHMPFRVKMILPVGTIGRIGFCPNQ